MTEITIGKRKIGPNYPPYFIADIAANHDGDINRAFKLIELAAEAGADAAKFQNFIAEKIVSEQGFSTLGQLSHQKTWKKSVFETYEEASIPADWSSQLKKKCDEVGIEYFTSPYDFDSVDLVDPYVACYKIGSGDITWLEILEYIAEKKKPLLLATGASDAIDVKRAVDVICKKNTALILMQCNTNYTASTDNFRFINLNVLNTFKSQYKDIILGLSDHTKGYATVLGAIAFGACVIEKHFTDDNNRNGPDHHFSVLPTEWKQMVQAANELYLALGNGIKQVEENEKQTVMIQRRSLYMKNAKKKGDIIVRDDLSVLRPFNQDGFVPYEINMLIGKKYSKDIEQGVLLKKDDVI